MLNTYGLRSINLLTFNNYDPNENLKLGVGIRNTILTVLRVHNCCLNILGYHEESSKVSGLVRMITGLSICLTTLTIGDRSAPGGYIVGKWYDEALLTGVAQAARGSLEAFVSHGRRINLALDAVGTVINLLCEWNRRSFHVGLLDQNVKLITNPTYPLPFQWLYLV